MNDMNEQELEIWRSNFENRLLRDYNLRCPRHMWLPRLKPNTDSVVPVEKQQSLIDAVRKHSDEGWAFFGAPRAGKTTFANALFAKALFRRLVIEEEAGNRVLYVSLWRITARALCQQAQDRATQTGSTGEDYMCGNPGDAVRAARKIVSREAIERAADQNTQPCLFIEEWDKVGLTDFRRETLFDILDAMHTAGGQLVLTSNLSYAEFCATFGDTSWRIPHNCNIMHLDDPAVPKLHEKQAAVDPEIAAIL